MPMLEPSPLTDDGVVYVERLSAAPPRLSGRWPRTADEFSLAYHPELVPTHWLVQALRAGERRDELETLLRANHPKAFIEAVGWAVLNPLMRDEAGQRYLAVLLPTLGSRTRQTLAPMTKAPGSFFDVTERDQPQPEPTPAVDEVISWVATVLSSGEDPHQRRALWRKLTRLARPTALGIAARLADDAVLGFEAQVLLEHPTETALWARARALGVPAPQGSDVEAVLTAFPNCWLVQRGDSFPNGHDGAAAQLARLVSPVLDGVVFEEVPPAPFDDDDDDGAPLGERLEGLYRLRAYSGGTQREVLLEDRGKWLDDERVLALVNSLLHSRGDAHRLVVIGSVPESLLVAAIPQQTIAKLVEVGWL